MSLQGSLDTFALSDVLMLLAATQKTGELRIQGSRAADGTTDDWESSLEFVSGKLAGSSDSSVSLADAVFAMLRLSRGSFVFSADVTRDVRAGEPLVEVEPVLAEAAAHLEEWTDIERVVPSSSAWVRLAAASPSAELIVSADEWAVIAAIGSGRSVDATVRELATGELTGFRAIKELIEAGLVTIETRLATTEDRPVPVEHRAGEDRAGGAATELEPLQWATPVSTWNTTLPVMNALQWADPIADGADPSAYGGLHVVPDPEPVADPGSNWRTQLAGIHDLDSLVEQSAGDAPFQPAPDEISGFEEIPAVDDLGQSEGDRDEPLNRGLLLKFLSSVRD